MQLKLFLLIFNLFFKLLGTQPPQTAIILLQNNHELRATGGFMGSYAKIELTKNPQPTFNLNFQDIYVPDGQLKGHVDPPAPIQQAFGQGWFRLRDANWEPDFITSAKTIRWFFKKGQEINPDLLITTNLSTIQKILKITGPLKVTNLKQTISADNIFLTLQNQIQQNFFPGSTNKKDTLTDTGQALTQKLSSLNLKQKLKIANLIYQELKTGEILINSKDPKLQAFLEKRNWAGQLKPTSCKNCLQDTVAIIESNLGSNKANAYITRHTTHTISHTNQSIHHQITISYQNSSPSKNPNPPEHHGGDYLNYLRFYLPPQANNIQVNSGSKTNPSLCSSVLHWTKNSSKSCSFSTTPNKFGFKEIGFFHLTPHQSTSSITLSYQLPITNQKSYQLTLLKQPGVDNSPQTINLFKQTTKTNLTKDLHFKATNLK